MKSNRHDIGFSPPRSALRPPVPPCGGITFRRGFLRESSASGAGAGCGRARCPHGPTPTERKGGTGTRGQRQCGQSMGKGPHAWPARRAPWSPGGLVALKGLKVISEGPVRAAGVPAACAAPPTQSVNAAWRNGRQTSAGHAWGRGPGHGRCRCRPLRRAAL